MSVIALYFFHLTTCILNYFPAAKEKEREKEKAAKNKTDSDDNDDDDDSRKGNTIYLNYDLRTICSHILTLCVIFKHSPSEAV